MQDSPSHSPSPSPAPAPPTSSLHALRSTCLSILLSQQSHPAGFSNLTPPPKPLLSPLTDLQPSERALLVLWDELRDVVYARMKAEARAELVAQGALRDAGEGDNDDNDDEGEEDEEEREQRKIKLEQEIARLKADQGVKEEIALAAMTGREVQNVVYGMRAESGAASSVAKSRALRSLTHIHTTHLSTITHLHNALTTLQTQLTALSSQHLTQTSTNRLLTTRLLALTTQLSSKNQKSNIRDPDLRQKVEEMEAQLKEAKMRWEVARNVFQGVVAGSGVDWVRVEEGRLKGLMLEAGEEME